jgi:hypothetical protein
MLPTTATGLSVATPTRADAGWAIPTAPLPPRESGQRMVVSSLFQVAAIQLFTLQRRVDPLKQPVNDRAGHVAGGIHLRQRATADQQGVRGVGQRQSCVMPTLGTIPVLVDHLAMGVPIEAVAGQDQPVGAGAAPVTVGGAESLHKCVFGGPAGGPRGVQTRPRV